MHSFALVLHSHWLYGLLLVFSLLGLSWLDWRYKLVAFGENKPGHLLAPRLRATRATLLVMTGLFLVWDVSGIVMGVFRTNTSYTLGLNILTPNLPIEEVVFLMLLTYVSLLTYKAFGQYIKKNVRS